MNQYNVQMWTCSMWILVWKVNKRSLISEACRQQEGSRVDEWMNWRVKLGQPLVEVRLKWTSSLVRVWPILPPTVQQTDLLNRRTLGCNQQRAVGGGGWGVEWDSRTTPALSWVITPLHLPEMQTNKIRSKTCEGAAVGSAGVSAAHRAQASAAPRDGNDPPSADGDQPAPLYHQSGQLSRMRSCGDLDPLAGRYILFTTVLRNIRLLRCTSGSMWFPVRDHWAGLRNKTCIWSLNHYCCIYGRHKKMITIKNATQ